MTRATIANSLVIALLLMITACDSNRLYDESFGVDEKGWHADDIKTFQFDVEDTLSPVNLYVNIRTSTDYPYSNIYLFLYSEYPTGYKDKDTLEFILAKPDGKWLGENTGTIVENKALISSRGRFARSGTYTFKIQHAMRDSILPEIIDVGFRAELMDQNELK